MTFAGRIEAQVVLPAGETLEVTNNGGTSTVTLVAGSYYPTALCTHIQNALTAQRVPAPGAWTVALDTTTGKVTISISSGTFTIAAPFSSSTLAGLLGFTSDPTAVATATGANQMRGVWIPNRPIVVEGSDPQMAPLQTDIRRSRTPRGRVTGIGGGNGFHVHRRVYWEHVEKARIWEYVATTPNASWERFFTDTQLGRGHEWFRNASPVRIYDTSNTKVGIAANNGAGVAGWYIEGIDGVEPKRSIDHWTGAYTIEIPRIVAEPDEPDTDPAPVMIQLDGPENTMEPETLAQWQAVGGGWEVPDYQLRGQDLASPISEDVQGVTSMVAAGAPLYGQTLANWYAKWLKTAETATEGFYATIGQLWNTNVQSVLYIFRFRLVSMPGGLRVLAMLSGANGYVSINGSGILQLRNSGVTTGTYNYDDGAEHFCAIESICGAGILGHSGAGMWRLSTDKEQLTGTWEIVPDGVKGLGGCGTFTPPPVWYGRQEGWIGTKAEALSAIGIKPLMQHRGFTVTGY